VIPIFSPYQPMVGVAEGSRCATIAPCSCQGDTLHIGALAGHRKLWWRSRNEWHTSGHRRMDVSRRALGLGAVPGLTFWQEWSAALLY